jgi:hypothetical protein
MTIHAGEDDTASDADFEWVNTWAAAATARGAPAGTQVDPPADAAMHRGSGDVVRDAAGTPMPSRLETTAESPRDAEAEQVQLAVVPLLETARGRKRWTHLFRIIARESESPPGLPVLDVAEAARSQPAGPTQDAGEGNDADAMLDLAQIERDIAEIEFIRDRLLNESAPMRRRVAARLASARASDYVPIVVGGVLAFTSLVVFGAAASFVSLR